MKRRLIIGALPLLIYPCIAGASLMSLAGQTTGEVPVLLMAVARAFQIGSLIYPVVYLGSVVAALVTRKKNEEISAKIALVPLWFLALVCLLFVGWIALDRLESLK